MKNVSELNYNPFNFFRSKAGLLFNALVIVCAVTLMIVSRNPVTGLVAVLLLPFAAIVDLEARSRHYAPQRWGNQRDLREMIHANYGLELDVTITVPASEIKYPEQVFATAVDPSTRAKYELDSTADGTIVLLHHGAPVAPSA